MLLDCLAVRRIREWLKHNHADAIFSDGPPHTNTVVANRIAEEFDLPWVADFQHPWTQVDYYAHMKIGRRADRIHRRMEQDAFRRADISPSPVRGRVTSRPSGRTWKSCITV